MRTNAMNDSHLDTLAAQCLSVRDLIDSVGDPLMRAAIDLLLIEVGRALAQSCGGDGQAEA
ncbi:hypothetical protein FV242_10500 [Methylobacterium sp. WL64]|jgi:hypothetical protein|nr:hypothetical protein FVA80_30175 [Methylobacterium sp. WL1]TXN03722.1 hypothetical protein FV242_10500 [Methylobacterium sp. WL64]TXN48428.1 hypothetical protein FV233_01690 [Methylobacterium sp. WL7]TXN58157.1 hypothetical protein FV241_08340 [Methylobacterium sp. WL2]TXN65531.1 hypothetical protein FV228_15640 [Methylobacterium sp. WL18]